MKILVTGSIAYDVLLTYDGAFESAIDPAHLDELSMAFVTPSYERHHGGTAANIAWNLRLLNQYPLIVGTVGNDGEEYEAMLKARGMDTKWIEHKKDKVTATAIVATDKEQHQITFYHPGADAEGTWPDLSKERADVPIGIISPRDPRVMMEAADWCAAHDVPYILDPGQNVLAIPEKQLMAAVQKSRGVITNAYEWSLLSERLSLSTDQILKHTPLLVVTHGEEGLTLYTKDEVLVVPAFKVEKVVNPTGAGDALRAGLLTGMAANWPLLKCAQLGAVLASFVVEQHGTLVERLDLNDLYGRADIAYGETLPALP